MSEPAEASKKILLVEDHAPLAARIIQYLKEEFPTQIEIIWVTSLTEAKKVFESQEFAGIITDNHFPVRADSVAKPESEPCGMRLIKYVRGGIWGAEKSKTPVLFQSTGFQTALTDVMIRLGATACGDKTNPEQWGDFIRTHVLRDQAINVANPLQSSHIR